MANSKMPSKTPREVKECESGHQEGAGEAAAAEKNRQLEARLGIVAAYVRLGIPVGEWPEVVRTFHTNPQLQTRFSDEGLPQPFQPSGYDRLNQTPQEWAAVANREWAQHRDKFLQESKSWVQAGVDEQIHGAKRIRGPGKRRPKSGSRKRGDNTSSDTRYEWAARYLGGDPLKIVVSQDAGASSAGKAVREILGVAGWDRQAKIR